MSAMTLVAAALRVAEPFTVHSFHHTGAAHGGPGRRRWPLSLLTISCALAINSAYGQASASDEATSPFALDTTTITATRTANSGFALPASVSVVDRQQLDDAQVNTLATALRTLPNVNYGGGPRAAAQSPAIRGLQGPRIILTVDGARRNNDGGVNTPLLIDPDLIRQIDVVRGPMSAAYGSGGLGGVMAIETLNADDILDPGQSSGGRIKAGYRSANRESSSNLTLAARGDRADVLASGTYRDYGTIHTGASGADAQYPNDGQLKSGLLKTRFSPNELNHFELGYQRFADEMVGPTNPGGNLLFPFSQKLQREQEQYNASWAFEDAEQRLLDGKLAVYQTRFTLDGDSRSVPRHPTTATQTKTLGASLQNTSRIEVGSGSHHRVTYGVDGYRDTNENASDGQSNSVLPNGQMRALGGFVQDEMAFLDDWTLIAALRHDDYRLTSPGQDDSSHSRLSPKVALKYQPWEFLGVFVSYGEAFRAPTMTEMFGNLNTRRALFNFRPNPGLKPETSKTREVGATLAFDDLLAGGDSLRAKVTYFREDVDDLIDQQVVGRYARQAPFAGTGMIFQRVNVAQAERHGGEAQLSYQWQRLSLGAGYSRLRSRNADTGAQLYAPPDKLVLGGQYRLDEHWSLNYQGQYVWAQDYDATELRRRKGYVIHDIGGAFEYRQYRADLGVSNLFDKAYSTYQQSLANTFTYEEGRSVNLTLSARF
ncbi:TonB-dependent hemoglobin/transferrin/lactoferrin family receptor [Pseudomonas protegens]|uniref:TonB-dependent hemoglobin/transferrin/lactoferrin family receptor n=1 Tax=Pseudomonas protegens TaxID=380021 RepID=UPI000F4845C0|nr:TonB-dependent hemoglobin/transferrin/lactoferrin family receptor [Pseudomonas protegens]ROL96836.1 membrane receptor protein [Pseudomonas protegens]ROM03112.1 membrane receptor protein [Pseudomonas protegens]ROM08624.1 membrane receptor protein [Pseudomonas protegens]ROM12664.1 membrane receptor protein [Pseudomonas protegens]